MRLDRQGEELIDKLQNKIEIAYYCQPLPYNGLRKIDLQGAYIHGGSKVYKDP